MSSNHEHATYDSCRAGTFESSNILKCQGIVRGSFWNMQNDPPKCDIIGLSDVEDGARYYDSAEEWIRQPCAAFASSEH